jgi:cytochrome P450
MMIFSIANEALSVVLRHPIWTLFSLLLAAMVSWIVQRKRFIDAINKLPGLPLEELHPHYGHTYSLLQTIGRIPGHPSLPLTYVWFVEQCTKYAAQGHGIFRVWFFNPYRCFYARASVTVLDPELVHQLLTQHSKKLIKETRIYNASRAFFQDSFITFPDGPKWKHHRKMTASAFHSHLLELVCSTVHSLMTQHLFPAFDEKPDVELLGWCFRLTTEILGIVAFSHSFHSFDGMATTKENKKAGVNHIENEVDDDETLFDTISLMVSTIAKRLLAPPIFDWLHFLGKDNAKFVKACNKLNGVVGEVVKERLAKQLEDEANGTARTCTSNKRGTDILSHLLVRDEDGKRLSYNDIYCNVKLLLFAGHDTTAVAMSWGLWEMAANPRVQKKLQLEIDALYESQQRDDGGGGDNDGDSDIPPPYRQISRLEYLDAVVKETLRLHPPAQMARTTMEDITLEKGDKKTSYTIPKGTPTYVFPFCTQQMPSYLKHDAAAFYPERYLEAELEKESMHVYMPFSVGPRYCVGMPMAIAELKAIYCNLLRRYWIQPQHNVTTDRPIPVMMLTAKPHQVLVTMERRTQHS